MEDAPYPVKPLAKEPVCSHARVAMGVHAIIKTAGDLVNVPIYGRLDHI